MPYNPTTTDPQGQNQQYLLGNAPNPLEGNVQLTGQGTSGGGDAYGGAETQPASNVPTEVAAAQPQQLDNQYALDFSGSGPAIDRIYNTLSGGAETQGQAVQTATDDFYQQTTPERNYADIGAQDTLQGAIYGGGNLDAGRDLVNARYEGPAGLAENSVSNIYGHLNELKPASQSLYTGRGLETLIRQAAPGINRGEAKFEAQGLSQNPGHREQSTNINNAVNQVYSSLRKNEAETSAYGGRRQEQEADIAKQSRDYLEGDRQGVSDAIDQRIAGEQSNRTALKGYYDTFNASGSQEDLAAIPEQYRDFDPADFNTQNRQDLAASKEMWDYLMGAYPNLEGQDLLQLRINDHGKETQARENMSGSDPLLTRQADFNKWFAPRTGTLDTKAPYAKYRPLYFNDDPVAATWEPPDIRGHVSLQQDPTLDRHSVSTQDERTRFNNINTMLSEVDRLEDVGQPFQAATIAGNLEGLLAEEESQLAAREKYLGDSYESWVKQLGSARDRFRRAKSKSKWGTITRIVAGVGTLGLSELGGLTVGGDEYETRMDNVPGSAGAGVFEGQK